MRSGSSLLNHKLLSNPSVSGMGEMNMRYKNENQLTELIWKYARNHKTLFPKSSYFLDQINHNKWTPDEVLFQDDKLDLIILFREPVGTIKSLLELSKKYYNDSWTQKKAEEYYINRLIFLHRVAQEHPDTIIINHKHFIFKPEQTLQQIESKFILTFKDYTSYTLHNFTGIKGDPSEKIKLGKIIAPEIIPAEQRKKHLSCWQYYDQLNQLSPIH